MSKLALAALLMLTGGFLRAQQHAVILIYHHVDATTPASTSVTPERFDRHLEILESGGFNVIGLEQIFSAIRNGKDLPEKAIAITFDDAYESVYRTAWPKLEQRKWPFSVFVSTESIDLGHKPYMNWAELKSMARSGVEIGNHGHKHDYALQAQPGESDHQRLQRFRANIEKAQALIIEHIGVTPTVYAYPYGEYDAASEAVVASLEFNAVGQQSGVYYAGDRSTSAPRFPIATGYDSDDAFRLRINALPLPLSLIDPVRVVTVGSQPDLRFRLTANTGPLSCFVNGQAATVERSDDGVVSVPTPMALKPGRSKTTCTAQHSPGVSRWYSHLWVVQD
ncbi:MAG: polysaccharide deacetylase family protein [Proteobacteria bacterium]|nr:polysaccharide deacetylase family protein [Pseudomonadota bacterium]